MMEIRKLKELISEHTHNVLKRHSLSPRFIPNLPAIINRKEIIVVSGVRRCGKSSLMRIILHDLIKKKKIPAANVLYLNFEDERFVEFAYKDFDALYESYLELSNPKGKKYLFFDEIQNITYWEKWINRIYEFEEVKIFITGSNATLLSGEIATALTGRNVAISLFPFSFREFSIMNGISAEPKNLYNREGRIQAKRNFNTFMDVGGFPEAAITKGKTILQSYFKDILYRDILARYSIRNIKEMKELALYLATNMGNMRSYRNLAQTISVNSINTIKNFLEYLENAYLFFRLGLFDYSLKKQLYNPSKIYCVDAALACSMAFKFSHDIGRIYENIAFLELMRRGKDIYYWKSPHDFEVDFVVKEGTRITEIIQVCADMSGRRTQTREVRSVLEAASEFNLKKVVIITDDFTGEILEQGVEIFFIPLWQWLLQG